MPFTRLPDTHKDQNMSQNLPIYEMVALSKDARSYVDPDKKDEEVNLVTCPNCYLKTPSNRIVKCAECGHVGCKECFTYDPSNKAYYCDNCW